MAGREAGRDFSFSFVELNCENLFDCVHDSLKDDHEFLPDGMRHWTFGRYWRKLNNIAREIVACGGEGEDWKKPNLVALVEVENDSVLTMLTKHSLLKKARYEYVMTDSPDERGVDVALLYDAQSFTLQNSYAIRVPMTESHRPTRDILYAKGSTVNAAGTAMQDLHVFVIHAPSRSGGETASEPYRLLVSNKLCEHIDSIRSLQPDARIIVAGDFNDYHNNKSVTQLSEHSLFNVSANAQGTHGAKGTYRYRGEWGSLDQILVSETMRNEWQTITCEIFDAPFLCVEDEKYGGPKPRRTYNGPKYDGDGFSDHLPLVVRFY